MAKKKKTVFEKLFNKEAMHKALLELCRLAVSAAASLLVLFIAQELAGTDPTSIQFLVLTFAYRVVNTYINKNKDIPLDGITGM